MTEDLWLLEPLLTRDFSVGRRLGLRIFDEMVLWKTLPPKGTERFV